MAPEVVGTYTGTKTGITQPTVTADLPITPLAGDVVIAIVMCNGTNSSYHTLSGLGATWSHVARDSDYHIFDYWIGVGATSSGTATATMGGTPGNTDDLATKRLSLVLARGTSGSIYGVAKNGVSVSSMRGPIMSAGEGQIVIGSGYSDQSNYVFLSPNPTAGWVSRSVDIHDGLRWGSLAYRVPSGDPLDHSFEVIRLSSAKPIVQVVLGDYEAPEATIDASYSGQGSLVSRLSEYQRIAPAMSGEGVLTTNVRVSRLETKYSGAGSLSTTIGDGKELSTTLSGAGGLTTKLVKPLAIGALSGRGLLWTEIQLSPRFATSYSGEGVLTTELEYTTYPVPLGDLPLGKLSQYNVSMSAVPLNPAEGSGATPGVSATYIKGKDPEYALNEAFSLVNERIGVYEGEIVSVDTNKNSDRVAVNATTPLSLLNTELKVLPLIMAEAEWLPLRSIDYWTQAAGLFYDKAPGDVLLYCGGFGHTMTYLKGFPSHQFYEVMDSWDTRPESFTLNGRQVWDHGDNVVAPTRMPSNVNDRLAVTFPYGKRLAFSTGFGVRGTARRGAVTWNFYGDRYKNKHYSVALSYTSGGNVTVALESDRQTVEAFTTNVPTGSYRATFSFEKASERLINAKLTIHSDDLNGNGELVFESVQKVFRFSLPSTVLLEDMALTSNRGGSGALLYRYGTYMSVVEEHPMSLPVVQKELHPARMKSTYTPGFKGNVWAMLNQFASIYQLDVTFEGGKLKVKPRSDALTRGVDVSTFGNRSEVRDKYKQVALVNHRARPNLDEDVVLWRSDSVYSVTTLEVIETTIQTDNSLLSVLNPTPVKSINPFPYQRGGGQYVVTAADGKVVDPQWWTTHGGKVEVALTENEGEFLLRIQGPATHMEKRSPYRIAEVDDKNREDDHPEDRPALYICGSGVITRNEEIRINTGATNAREGAEQVFDSPFVTNRRIAYDVGALMAREYSTGPADGNLEEPNRFGEPSTFGTYPSGQMLTDGERNYRVTNATLNPSGMSASVEPFTTIKAYKNSFTAGATIADEKRRHRKKRIRHVNMKPLKEN